MLTSFVAWTFDAATLFFVTVNNSDDDSDIENLQVLQAPSRKGSLAARTSALVPSLEINLLAEDAPFIIANDSGSDRDLDDVKICTGLLTPPNRIHPLATVSTVVPLPSLANSADE
jgi:hypothetical protein